MKLVTIPSEALQAAAAPQKADGVLSALRRAADETGADFSYLLNTAMRESSLNPGAKAASSSATGLFQFIEQTWLGTVHQYGAEHGLKAYADAIEVGSNGRFQVADKALRQEILALRKDPETAALMAGEMTGGMQADMEGALGRRVSAGELYAGHFLGPKAATKFIKAAEQSPQASAAHLFPQAAAANRSIFYTKGGAERSTSAVMAALASKHSGTAIDENMMLAANEPARSTPWRGAVTDPSLPQPTGGAGSYTPDQSMVLAPIMVQLLAALDPLPHIASVLSTESALRPTDRDPI